jgi:hypothetical protein
VGEPPLAVVRPPDAVVPPVEGESPDPELQPQANRALVKIKPLILMLCTSTSHIEEWELALHALGTADAAEDTPGRNHARQIPRIRT